jgi:arylsulfatase A-like enzyme/tetratricopeptide (TPR) repeat protein
MLRCLLARTGTISICACALLLLSACSRSEKPPPGSSGKSAGPPPSILLVTLDTTRADAIGPEAKIAATPVFNALAARGLLFRQAYATAPETLPSHASLMTGLYPAGHGVHENGRFLAAQHAVAAAKLHDAGYRTAAFVSSFVLARRFGLARGFDLYDDELTAGGVERRGRETTDRAIKYLSSEAARPVFMWVHYYDPHTPYAPEERFRRRYRGKPYFGEIAAIDEQLGRLVSAFEARTNGQSAVIVVGDHGEGLGDHGEAQHGNLLYGSTMRVPLLVAGPGVVPGTVDRPVSTRHVFHTILDWAGQGGSTSLRSAEQRTDDVVVGEAMKPFLGYGWQPQIMAIEGSRKAILAGTIELYDVAADPGEARNLHGSETITPPVRKALDDYPVPSPDAAGASPPLTEEAKRRLASLGYVSASTPPPVRKDAPRPADMTALFEPLERASALFVQERYKQVIPLLEKISKADPHNLDAALRLATAYSSLGQNDRAEAAFKKAEEIAPRSRDVQLYLALHHARGRNWAEAVPILEHIVAETPERLPALEALARIRERQRRLDEALTLRSKIYSMREPTAGELVHLGQLAMAVQQTPLAIESFEKARGLQGEGFRQNLELGVLYMDARRFEDARAALDRVPPSHPEYPMALFKRAQVSVLLNEPDRAKRIAAARQHADATTRELIERERLFQR